MNASTPIWATILIALLAQTVTAGGVIWTQRFADRRAEREARLRLAHAEREAKLRLDHEIQTSWQNQRIPAYQELFVIMNQTAARPWDMWKTARDTDGLLQDVVRLSFVSFLRFSPRCGP